MDRHADAVRRSGDAGPQPSLRLCLWLWSIRAAERGHHFGDSFCASPRDPLDGRDFCRGDQLLRLLPRRPKADGRRDTAPRFPCAYRSIRNVRLYGKLALFHGGRAQSRRGACHRSDAAEQAALDRIVGRPSGAYLSPVPLFGPGHVAAAAQAPPAAGNDSGRSSGRCRRSIHPACGTALWRPHRASAVRRPCHDGSSLHPQARHF